MERAPVSIENVEPAPLLEHVEPASNQPPLSIDGSAVQDLDNLVQCRLHDVEHIWRRREAELLEQIQQLSMRLQDSSQRSEVTSTPALNVDQPSNSGTSVPRKKQKRARSTNTVSDVPSTSPARNTRSTRRLAIQAAPAPIPTSLDAPEPMEEIESTVFLAALESSGQQDINVNRNPQLPSQRNENEPQIQVQPTFPITPIHNRQIQPQIAMPDIPPTLTQPQPIHASRRRRNQPAIPPAAATQHPQNVGPVDSTTHTHRTSRRQPQPQIIMSETPLATTQPRRRRNQPAIPPVRPATQQPALGIPEPQVAMPAIPPADQPQPIRASRRQQNQPAPLPATLPTRSQHQQQRNQPATLPAASTMTSGQQDYPASTNEARPIVPSLDRRPWRRGPAPPDVGSSRPINQPIRKPVIKTAAEIYRVLSKDLPEDIIGVKKAMNLHLRILWGLLDSAAIPKDPPPSVLNSFSARFSNENDLHLTHESGPELVAHDLIEIGTRICISQKSLGKGKGNNIIKQALFVEENMLQYIKSRLSRFGFHRWCPDYNQSAYSLYNSACRLVAIETFKQALVSLTFDNLGAKTKYANDMDTLVKLYDHFIFYYMQKRYKKNLRHPGSVESSQKTSPIYQNRLRLSNARLQFLVENKYPERYQRLVHPKATSDDEPDASGNVWIIKRRPERSEKAEKFIRLLDIKRKADIQLDCSRQWKERPRVVPAEGQQDTSFPGLPEGMPIDYFDPIFFNGQQPRTRHRIAIPQVAFLPNVEESFDLSPDERLSDSLFTRKYGRDVFDCYHMVNSTEPGDNFYQDDLASEDDEDDMDEDEDEDEDDDDDEHDDDDMAFENDEDDMPYDHGFVDDHEWDGDSLDRNEPRSEDQDSHSLAMSIFHPSHFTCANIGPSDSDPTHQTPSHSTSPTYIAPFQG